MLSISNPQLHQYLFGMTSSRIGMEAAFLQVRLQRVTELIVASVRDARGTLGNVQAKGILGQVLKGLLILVVVDVERLLGVLRYLPALFVS